MMKRFKIAMMILSAVFIVNCSDDDEAFQATGLSQIDTDQGAKFTLIYSDGKEKKVSASKVFGFSNGSLLDGDYYKHLSGTAEDVKFSFRFSLPENIKSADVIEGNHQLRSTRLRLEQTGNLEKLETEFWLGSTRIDDQFDGYTNVVGMVTYQQDIAANDKIIEIVIEIEGSVVNREGKTVSINGIIWKAKDDVN